MKKPNCISIHAYMSAQPGSQNHPMLLQSQSDAQIDSFPLLFHFFPNDVVVATFFHIKNAYYKHSNNDKTSLSFNVIRISDRHSSNDNNTSVWYTEITSTIQTHINTCQSTKPKVTSTALHISSEGSSKPIVNLLDVRPVSSSFVASMLSTKKKAIHKTSLHLHSRSSMPLQKYINSHWKHVRSWATAEVFSTHSDCGLIANSKPSQRTNNRTLKAPMR